VNCATNEEEHTDNDGTKAGTVAVVVVVGALPEREAIGKVMVVALTTLTTQNVGNQGQTSLALGSLLHGILNIRLRRCLATLVLALGALSAKLLGDLVGMQRTCLQAVSLVDVILRGGVCDSKDLVESRSGVGFVRGDLVTDAEDFTIWTDWSV
jgi:hypothetical protein